MPTTAELIQKENAALSKAKETYRNRVQKLEQNEFKRILKYLKKIQENGANKADLCSIIWIRLL